MEDTQLDDLLHHAAADASVPSSLRSHRAAILAEARARRVHRVRLWTASVAAAAVLVGGGSVAVAGDGDETPWGWVADNVISIERMNGSECFQGFLVKWDGVTEDDPMVQDAKAIISGIDLTTLDTTHTEAEVRAGAAEVTAVDGDTPREMSDAEVRLEAVGRILSTTLFDELLARGHDLRPGHEVILTGQSTDCS